VRKHLPLYLALVLGAALLAAIAASYLSGQTIQRWLFNADEIQMPALFEDVLGHGGSFSQWNLAPAPGIFPEFLMYALAYVLGPTIFWRILFYTLIQVTLFSTAIFLLANEILRRSRVAATILVVSALTLLGLLGITNFRQLFQGSFHFGGILCQLFSLVLVLKLARPENSKSTNGRLLAGIAVIAVFASLSDALYAAQFLMPLAVWCLLRLIRREATVRQTLVWAGIPAIAGVVGLLLYKVVIPNAKSVPAKISFSTAFQHVAEMRDQLGIVFSHSPVTSLFLLAVFLFSLVASVYFLFRRGFLGLSYPLHSFIVLSFFAGVFSLLACVFSMLPPDPRYLLPLFIWPFIVVTFIAAELGMTVFFRIAAPVAVALTAACCLLAGTGAGANGLSTSYYPSAQQCLDEAALSANVTHGVAEYWDAKPLQEFSRAGITLAQVSPSLQFFRWSSTNSNERSTFDFAVINNAADASRQVSLEALKQINGQPKTKTKCGHYTFVSWGAGGLSLASK